MVVCDNSVYFLLHSDQSAQFAVARLCEKFVGLLEDLLEEGRGEKVADLLL